mmetsp:Transcript_60288/g.191527  ORF Transcript_60288/g.191527 Transcript_60288/m.191527 type:complete len:180 (+) Transcript_60288:173-712(+)
MAPLPLLQRPLDGLLVAFFALHIPITVFLDSQSVVPRKFFPKVALDLIAYHVQELKDPLVATNPPWFVALVWCELCIQLPFFFVLCYGLALGRRWLRIPAIMYGVHTCTTMAPILYELAFGPHKLLATSQDRAVILCVYLPWLVFPAVLTARMAASEDPFGEGKSQRKTLLQGQGKKLS